MTHDFVFHLVVPTHRVILNSTMQLSPMLYTHWVKASVCSMVFLKRKGRSRSGEEEGVGGTGKSGWRGNSSRDVMGERRINKNIKIREHDVCYDQAPGAGDWL